MTRLHGVAKRYGRGAWVLDRVDLTIAAGQVVHVAGGNGSGKSTLLRLVAGVTRPTRGTVTGRPPVVGWVPDRFPATGAMSSLAYLTHAGRIRGLPTVAARRQARLLLDRLGLAGGPHTPIRALSKGNIQKVALAQALIRPPGLLVLDEPWSGLDAPAHAVLRQILAEVVRDGGAVIFTDHREAAGRSPATVTCRIEDGRITWEP